MSTSDCEDRLRFDLELLFFFDFFMKLLLEPGDDTLMGFSYWSGETVRTYSCSMRHEN